MHTTSEIAIEERAIPTTSNWPVAVLGLMMFLVPAVGATTELLLQDTLKSAMVAFGVLGAALLFFWQQRQRTEPLLWHGLVALPLALMFYALASMAWSHTYLAAVEAIRWFVLALLLWLGLNTLNRNNLPTLAWGIHGGAVVASIWAALQFWLDFQLFSQGPNPASTFVNRNFFAEYAVCTLPFSVYVLTRLRESRWLTGGSLSLALVVVAIMMTGTRSALMAMVVITPVLAFILFRYHHQFAFASWPRSIKAWVSLILVASVLGLGSIPSGNLKIIAENTGTTALQRSFLRVASMGEKKEYVDGSFSIRAVMWKATARMMLANPITGVGAGAWEVQIPLYQRVGESIETDYYAHNDFLQLLSEYGVVVGGLFLAVLFAYLLLSAGKTWHLHGADVEVAPLRALTLTSLLALMVVSNAGFPWRLASTGALFALCLAILAASDARLGFREAFFARTMHWSPITSRVALVLLLCCTTLATYISIQAGEAERKLVHAIKLMISLRQTQRTDMPSFEDRKTQALKDIREGVAINPHYRKLTAEMAEPLAAAGDWANAVWILESVAASRPHVAAIWTGIAMGHAVLGEHDLAQRALQQVQRLKPEATGTRTLGVILLNRAGRPEDAVRLLNTYFDRKQYDYDMVQTGYTIGYQTHNWPLAIRSLELKIMTWPEQAADGYLRLGKLYADPAVRDDTKALAAFRAGLKSVPDEQKENFHNQVPSQYRTRM